MFFATRFPSAIAVALAAAACYVAPAQAQEGSSSGEVRRVDPKAGKVTIKHGAIVELDLPAMILVFRADPALLVGLQPGDKIKFTARRENGQYVVIEISK